MFSSALLINKSDVKKAMLIASRDFADFCIAVHYLPKGFLWSSTLRNYQIGLLGTYSSLCRVPSSILGIWELLHCTISSTLDWFLLVFRPRNLNSARPVQTIQLILYALMFPL
jgi:hypothetical protein